MWAKIIINIVADRVLLPLIKELLEYLVNPTTRGLGVDDSDYREITDIMSKSNYNTARPKEAENRP